MNDILRVLDMLPFGGNWATIEVESPGDDPGLRYAEERLQDDRSLGKRVGLSWARVRAGKKLKIGREIEGGNQEMNEIDLPCVLSIQTGINEPRYVGIRGIRKVASVEIPVHTASDLGVSADAAGESAAKVKRVDYFVPDLGAGAEMLEGSAEEIIEPVPMVPLIRLRANSPLSKSMALVLTNMSLKFSI